MNRIFTKSKRKPITFTTSNNQAQNPQPNQSLGFKINTPLQKSNENSKEESNFQWFDKLTVESGEVLMNDTKSIKSGSSFHFSQDGLFSQKNKNEKSSESEECQIISEKKFE